MAVGVAAALVATFVVTAALAIDGQSGGPSHSSVDPNPRSRDARFYIVGPDIVTPNRQKFYPVGANIGIKDNFDWRGTGEGHSSDALAWGWNTVRLTILCTPHSSFSVWAAQGYDALWQQVDAFVHEYTSHGIVVIIECHDAVDDQNDADRFWHDAAVRYRENPYVWFNAANEPTWNNNTEWLRIQRHYLDLIRSTGAENIFVADVQNAGNDAGWGGALPVYDPAMGPSLVKGQCNVLFSQHEYGGVDDSIGAGAYWDNVHRADLAMIIGEFGYKLSPGDDPGAYQQNRTGADSVFEVAPTKGIGMLWWHATHGDDYSLKANGNAFYDGGPSAGLSDGGQRLWDIGHNPPVLGAFKGDIARSGCTSATAP